MASRWKEPENKGTKCSIPGLVTTLMCACIFVLFHLYIQNKLKTTFLALDTERMEERERERERKRERERERERKRK